MDVKSLQHKCLEQAASKLKSIGIDYPYYDSKLSRQANYQRTVEYSMRQSALMIECLANMAHQPAQEVIKQKHKLEPRKAWGNAYND